MTGGKVRFVDANVHGVRAPLAGLTESRLHERSPQALPPPGRSDIEFRQVTLKAGAPDGGPEAEHGQPVWPVPGKQDQRVAAAQELPHPVCQCGSRRRRLIELPVEVVEQPPNRASIIKARTADKVLHGSSHHGPVCIADKGRPEVHEHGIEGQVNIAPYETTGPGPRKTASQMAVCGASAPAARATANAVSQPESRNNAPPSAAPPRPRPGP